jgi:glycosyltransferase involved in cell wall biosynthesis
MATKKILMIIGQYYPIAGGAERECQKLSRRLAQEGMKVSVLTQYCKGIPDDEVIDGIHVYRKMRGWHLFEYTYMLSVFWFLLRHIGKYDVIQCFGLYLFIPPVALIRCLFGKRAIARIEGPGDSGDFKRIKKLRCGNLILSSAKVFDRIVAISDEICREIKAHGIPDQSVIRIPNSVDVAHFQPGRNGRGRGGGNICFIGRLAAEKGVDYLIKAMGKVKKEVGGIKLFLVGDGPLRRELEDLSRHLNLMDNTVFVGHADAVLTYYQGADIFVLPSLSEGLPLSLLEALSCGLPVVATAVGGSREILDPKHEEAPIPRSAYRIGECGLLVNPEDIEGLADAVLRLINDRVLSDSLSKKARSCAQQRYGVDKVIGDYRKLYSELEQA